MQVTRFQYMSARLKQLEGVFPPKFSRWLAELESQPPKDLLLPRVLREIAARSDQFISK